MGRRVGTRLSFQYTVRGPIDFHTHIILLSNPLPSVKVPLCDFETRLAQIFFDKTGIFLKLDKNKDFRQGLVCASAQFTKTIKHAVDKFDKLLDDVSQQQKV